MARKRTRSGPLSTAREPWWLFRMVAVWLDMTEDLAPEHRLTSCRVETKVSEN